MNILALYLLLMTFMLMQDALESSTMYFISQGSWGMAMLSNSAKDGVGFVTNIAAAIVGVLGVLDQSGAAHIEITPSMVAAGLGEMSGAAAGVLVGHLLSHTLDRIVPWWHATGAARARRAQRSHQLISVAHERLTYMRRVEKMLTRFWEEVDHEAFANLMRREKARIANMKDLQGR